MRGFKNKLEEIKNIEFHIAIKNNKLAEYNNKWHMLDVRHQVETQNIDQIPP